MEMGLWAVGSRDICLRETLCSWLCCPCPEDFPWGFPHPMGSLPVLVLPASLLQAALRVQYCAHSPFSPKPGLTRTREFGPGFQLQQEGSRLDPRRHIRTLRSYGRMNVGREFLRPRASNRDSERGGVVGGGGMSSDPALGESSDSGVMSSLPCPVPHPCARLGTPSPALSTLSLLLIFF